MPPEPQSVPEEHANGFKRELVEIQFESSSSALGSEEIRDYLEGCASFTMFLTAVAPAPMPKWQKHCISGCIATDLTEFLIPHTCSALSVVLKSITIQQSTGLSPLLNLTGEFC